MKRRIEVVGALCVDGGRVLVAQRPVGAARGGLWELPGGKVEVGETDPDALRRELQEELALSVEVGPRTHVVAHEYEELHVELRIYLCRPLSAARALEAAEIRWASAEELPGLPPCPADASIWRELSERGVPAWPALDTTAADGQR